MDEEFYKIYESLYNSEGAREPVVYALIQEAVTQFEQDSNRRVRPDAKLWLLVNFRDLILIPKVARYPVRAVETITRIQKDLRTILDRLSGTEGEISAHVILVEVEASWNDLHSVAEDW